MAGILGLLMSGAGLIKDQYFNLTTLLLPGNGTNGAQNNTFLDSSSNNFTITRNGNTTQGTFSPFSQTGWGNYFGTSKNLYLNGEAGFAFGSSADFAIEFFFYANSVSADVVFYDGRAASTQGAYPTIYLNNSTRVVSYVTSGLERITGTTTISLNVWYHVLLSRSGGNTRLFVNGTQQGSTYADTTNYINPAGRPYIAVSGFSANGYLDGYISNLRVLNGTGFTSATVPTAPFATGTTNQVLLTCQANRFVDSNTATTAKTINLVGSPSVVAFSPFAPTAVYTTTAVGGSGYFDGTGDYLSVADNANLRFGTSAFTIQAWVYRNASGVAHSIIAKGSASTGYVLQVTSTNVLRFTHGTTSVDTTTTIPASAWTHVAAVRTNTSTNGFQLYINGVSSATATVATDFNQTDTLYIGSDRSAANVMNGYISGLKYTNGTAESISVPTDPPTATTNVVLLTNFTNAGIYDATSKNYLETVGNAQISTAQYKFPPSSMAFDGNGDYLFTPSNVDFVFNGDFTIEFWVYRAGSSAGGTGNYECLLATYNGSTGYGVWWLNTTNVLHTRIEGTTADTTTALSNSTWYHVAITRSGSTVRTFVNGVQGSSFTSSATAANPGLYIGAQTGNKHFNGYIQDLRITKGYARYTANFTAPTAPFPVQ